jgi:hypothetical protein
MALRLFVLLLSLRMVRPADCLWQASGSTIGDDPFIEGESASLALIRSWCQVWGARVFLPADDGKIFTLMNILMIDIFLTNPCSLEQCGPGDCRGGHTLDKHHPPEWLGE